LIVYIARAALGGFRGSQKAHVRTTAAAPLRPAGVVEDRGARCYIGQFSHQGDLFVAAYQDAHIRIFDVEPCATLLRCRVPVHLRFRH
jgi:hypothetical protein